MKTNCQEHAWKYLELPKESIGKNILGKVVSCYGAMRECSLCKYTTWSKIDEADLPIFFGTPI